MSIRHHKAILTASALLLAAWASAQPPADSSNLYQRIQRLEERVTRAESLRAIKRLQYAYGHYVEFGLWHDFADLFAEDAVAHYPAGDLNREAIRELFLEQVGGGQLGLADGRLYPHFVLQPVVTLDATGSTARGRWHVLTLLGGYGGNATWVGSVYENDYVLDGGAWKISELRTHTQFSGSYADGWTNARAPAGAPSAICENYLFNDCSIAPHYQPADIMAPLSLADAAKTQASGTAALGTDASAANASAVNAPAVDAPAVDAPGARAPEATTAETDARAAFSLDLANRRAAELERRVMHLLDQAAVANLQHAYAYYFERKLWDDVADLFAADATLEFGLEGVYRGRDSIRRGLDRFGAQAALAGELNEHLQLETVVTVAPDGRSAQARGIDFALVGVATDGGYRSEWREAVFENVYVKEDGLWKIAAMHLYPRFATDYAQGWSEDAQPPPSASEAFPPDEPPTVVHGVYPEFFIPPFHFDNPVTAAPPRYPEGFPARRSAAPVGESVLPLTNAAISAATTIESLAARLTEIEQQLDRAIGYDTVENIVNAYNFALDEFDGDLASELLTDDGSIVVRNADVSGDRERVRFLIAAPRERSAKGRPAGFLAMHQTLQPVIHVSEDAQSAAFRFRVIESTGRLGEDGAWIAGIYGGAARRVDGAWKLSDLTLDLTWAADYSTGWASAAPFARLAAVPFHYANPVSGRPPPAAEPR
jgi:hypothetical protein